MLHSVFQSGLVSVMRPGVQWLVLPLGVQTIAGLTLAFRGVSLNAWEPNQGIHSFNDRLAVITGVVFLSGAGLGWYLLLHNRVLCWGFGGLPLLKQCLDIIALVLLYFVWFGRARARSSESTDGD